MSAKVKKEKKKVITSSACRRIRRDDGLVMKFVPRYTFPSFLEAVTSRYGSRTAYRMFGEGEEKAITYDRLRWNAESTASYLLSHGIAKGDRVAIMGESCPLWMVMYLGVTITGAVAVPILPDFSSFEVSEILRQSGARAICINTKHHRKAEEMIESEGLMVVRMDDLMHIPAVSEGETFASAPGISLRECAIDRKALAASVPEEDDTASIIFTSGTTGSSKGVVLSHKNLLVSADESTDAYISLKPGMRVLSILPMSHVYEFSITHILCLMQGLEITFLGKPPATTVLMKAFKVVRPHVILTVPLLIEKIYRSAVLPTIRDDAKVRKLYANPLTRPIVLRTVRNKLISTMGGCMRFFGVGGAPWDREVEEFMYRCGFPYALGYGLTETSPMVAGCGPEKRQHKVGYIGKVVKHDSVILLDKNEEGVGEIAVKGPNVMKGYYNNDKLNSEVFTPDGYFRTGDLGYLDKDGFLAVRGRVKTMILGPAGENIYPEPIEGLINNMEFVQESLVVPGGGRTCGPHKDRPRGHAGKAEDIEG